MNAQTVSLIAAVLFAVVASWALILTASDIRRRQWLRLKLAEGRYLGFETAEKDLLATASVPSEAKGTAAAPLFEYNEAFRLRIVIPRHEKAPGATARFLAIEDIQALELFLRKRPEILESQHVSELLADPKSMHADYANENLLLIGSPVSDDLTGVVLEDPHVRQKLDCWFDVRREEAGRVPSKSPGGRALVQFGGESIFSPIYELEERFQLDPISFDIPFMDYGIILKVRSPLEPMHDEKDAPTVFILAGVGALGTLGAAVYLFENGEDLAAKVDGSEFAALVRVKCKEWRNKDERPTASLVAWSIPGADNQAIVTWNEKVPRNEPVRTSVRRGFGIT